ncbi:hypothetical protein ACTWQB_14670 [Piscibacillus sp. B03]|uniref:hypothetical protein n=1 Tax=Piscibacillus sp. B03 TaxID=3457430 RepID=UPI003FCECC38
MFKRFLIVVTVVVTVFSLFAPTSFAGGINNIGNEESIDRKTSENFNVSEESEQLAVELSDYFETDSNGEVVFTADKETLIEMGISERDAELMISTDLNKGSFKEIKDEGEYQTQGFVGLHLNLGPRVRAMSAVAAGGFAAGYVGWHIKQIAKAGPWGAGAAAAITASVAGTVGYAVNKGLRKVSVGVNIPFVSMSYTVNIP